MTVYVYLELSLCICMEMVDLKKKPRKSEKVTLLLEKNGGNNPTNFQGVCVKVIPISKDLVQSSIFLYDIDFVDRAMIEELTGRSVGEHSNTVRLLRYKSHISYAFNINALFKAYRWPTPDQVNNKAGNLERHLTTYKERVKHICPKRESARRNNVWQFLTRLVSFRQTTKDSLTTWQFLTSNQSVWKKKNSSIPKQQRSLGNTFHFRYRFRPTWYKYPFSSVILILVTWYHLSLMIWRIWFPKVQLKWNMDFVKLKQQYIVDFHVSWKH